MGELPFRPVPMPSYSMGYDPPEEGRSKLGEPNYFPAEPAAKLPWVVCKVNSNHPPERWVGTKVEADGVPIGTIIAATVSYDTRRDLGSEWETKLTVEFKSGLV